jgi:hypothetical protein
MKMAVFWVVPPWCKFIYTTLHGATTRNTAVFIFEGEINIGNLYKEGFHLEKEYLPVFLNLTLAKVLMLFCVHTSRDLGRKE